jgi:hypothetical protein
MKMSVRYVAYGLRLCVHGTSQSACRRLATDLHGLECSREVKAFRVGDHPNGESSDCSLASTSAAQGVIAKSIIA